MLGLGLCTAPSTLSHYMPFWFHSRPSHRPTEERHTQDPRDDRPGLGGAHEAIFRRLEAFGTRNTMSNPRPTPIGRRRCAHWILKRCKATAPAPGTLRKVRVKKQGQRIFKVLDLYNVIAVLPGTKMPDAGVVLRALRFVEPRYASAGQAAGPGRSAPGVGLGGALGVLRVAPRRR